MHRARINQNDEGQRSVLQNGSGGPEVDRALVRTTLQHEISVNAPFHTPTVLDQPVVLVLCTVTHQHQRVVRPSRTEPRVGYSTLVMHQTSEVQQNGERTRLVQSITDNHLVVSQIHVTFNLHAFPPLIILARPRIVTPQRVILIGHQSTILAQIGNSHVGPSSPTPEISLITVNELLLGVECHILGLQVVQTLDVTHRTESPARTTRPLILNRTHRPLLHPVPHVRSCQLRLVVRVVREIFNVVHFRDDTLANSHQMLGLTHSQISEPSLPIDRMVLRISIEPLNIDPVLQIDRKTIEFNRFGLITLIVLPGVASELLVLPADGGRSKHETETDNGQDCRNFHRIQLHPSNQSQQQNIHGSSAVIGPSLLLKYKTRLLFIRLRINPLPQLLLILFMDHPIFIRQFLLLGLRTTLLPTSPLPLPDQLQNLVQFLTIITQLLKSSLGHRLLLLNDLFLPLRQPLPQTVLLIRIQTVQRLLGQPLNLPILNRIVKGKFRVGKRIELVGDRQQEPFLNLVFELLHLLRRFVSLLFQPS